MVGFHPLALTSLLASYNTNKTLKTVLKKKKNYKNLNYVLGSSLLNFALKSF